MKTLLLPFFLFLCLASNAQYYYKDIIGTRESAELIKAYKNNNVKRVVVNSYDANNTRSDDFYVEQTYLPEQQVLKTTTRSSGTDEAVLYSYTDEAGRVTKTVDSSSNMISTTLYSYNDAGHLILIKSSSSDTAKKINETEEHHWQYQNNQVSRMLRIKNQVDTTYVDLKLDDKGNVAEEQSLRKGLKMDPVYYYYDTNNRLTDIVRFNNKVRRLLPEYMFEYAPNSQQVIQKITVPANSSDYLIWRYQYDAGGLKIKEAIYDKHKALTGKIEYQYQRG
jgi:hypothetical protein